MDHSGWSNQGGFETYLDEPTLDLWDALWEAGPDLEVGHGCPNPTTRRPSNKRDDRWRSGTSKTPRRETPRTTCRACRCRSSAARECPHVPGIDSVMRPYDIRLQAWQRIATDLPIDRLGAMMPPAALAELPARGKSILAGGRKGRVVVEVNA